MYKIIFVLIILQRVKLNRFDTRMLFGESIPFKGLKNMQNKIVSTKIIATLKFSMHFNIMAHYTDWVAHK